MQTVTAGQRAGPQGLASLCLVARLHQVAADPQALHHQLGLSPSLPVGVDSLLLAARHLGLRAKRSRTGADRLKLAALPALALLHDGRTVVLAQCDGQRVLLLDPDSPGPGQQARPAIEPLEAFARSWSGELILIASRASLAGELARFDFSWFVPSLVKYRRLLGGVLLVSVFLQLFALVSPLFFQATIDKVLAHRGVTTLDVLVIGLLIVVVFESLLGMLRTYIVGAGDTVIEAAGAGTDTVMSPITWTLGNNVEHLTLTGNAAINGTGNALGNLLIGNASANVLAGGAGSDTYDGGAGNDSLTDLSLTSGDIYRWRAGSGTDTITDRGGVDRVDIGGALTQGQLVFARNGNHLELTATGLADKLILSNWYLSAANQVEEFRLSDGTSVYASEIQSLVDAMAVFGASQDAAVDTGRQTILPMRQPDIPWAASAVI